MSMSESDWIARAQSAEAKLKTAEQAWAPAIKRVQEFKAAFGVSEKTSGEIDVDFVKFVKNLGIEDAIELRKEIDLQYNISGEPGDKPHIRIVHGG